MKRKLIITSLTVAMSLCQAPTAFARNTAPANTAAPTQTAAPANTAAPSNTTTPTRTNTPANPSPAAQPNTTTPTRTDAPANSSSAAPTDTSAPKYTGKVEGYEKRGSHGHPGEFRRVRDSNYVPKTNEDPYTVKQDDTMWNISRKYDVDLGNIIESNPQIPDADIIYPGETLYVPLESNGGIAEKGEIGASMTTNSVCQTEKETGSKVGVTSQGGETTMETEVASLVNKERAKMGLAPLTLKSDVSNVARVKSEDMRDRNYFSHTSPVYGSPFDMLASFGIKYRAAGENIAKGQKSAQAVMTAWMNSEGHRKNILNPNYKEIGIGFAKASNGTTYWTQQFVTR